MAQYISKDALVAEIKRILLIYTKRYDELAKYEVWITAKEIEHRIQGLKEALSILNTLEVKEVDLAKEISFQWSKFCLNGKDRDSFVKVAKHFFELGLKAKKEEVE